MKSLKVRYNESSISNGSRQKKFIGHPSISTTRNQFPVIIHAGGPAIWKLLEYIIRSYAFRKASESFLWFAHYSNRLEENIYNEDRPDYLLLDRYLYTSIIYQYILLDIEQVSSFREFSEIIERIFHFGIFNKVKNNTSVIIFSANIDALAERFQKRENRTLITEERTILERSIKYYNDNSLGWISGIKNHLIDTSYKSIEQVAELILNLDL